MSKKHHGFTWDEEPEPKADPHTASPAFIRRLGDLSAGAFALFERLEAAITPLVADRYKPGHRIRTLDEMYVEVAPEAWISRVAGHNRQETSSVRTSLKTAIFNQSAAARPNNVLVSSKVVQSAIHARLEGQRDRARGSRILELLVLEDQDVLRDRYAARRWAKRNGLDIPQASGLLAMSLLAPTDDFYPRQALNAAIDRVKRIMPPGTVIPLGEVVAYSDVFDASGHLLPTQQQRA